MTERIGAGARRDVQPVGGRIQCRQAAPVGLQGVDDGIGVGVDHRDRPRTAVHGIDTAIAGIDRQILDVGAGLEHDHGARGAVDDLHDAEVGKRRVRLAVAGVDDNTLGTVRDADLGADGRRPEMTDERGDARVELPGAEDLDGGRRNVLWLPHEHEENPAGRSPVPRRVAAVSAYVVAQQPAAPRPRVLAFFTAGGELDHVLFAQQAMRALAASAGDGGYAFAATTDWDDLNDANLRDVRLVIWLNDMPRTPAQRQAFERYMTGGGAWLGFHVSGFGNNAWPWFTEFMGGSRFTASNWPSLPARVNVDDGEHPIVKGVPPTFVAPINEWYSWTPSPRVNPDVKVLLTLDDVELSARREEHAQRR